MKFLYLPAAAALLLSSCTNEEPAADSANPAAAPSAAAKAYPLEVCLVSGEKLGSMGEPTDLVHEGQNIKFCCDSCEPKFAADPDKYLQKLQAQGAE